jgi:hypothetical protein
LSAVATAHPNPETVEALLDMTWRVADAEAARTDGLDRKLTSLATFASLLISVVAVLGGRVLERDDVPAWLGAIVLGPTVGGVAALLAAVGLAVGSLIPEESVTLGMERVRRFPSWSEVTKPPEQVRGETMRTLVDAIARERAANIQKLRRVRAAFALMLAGLALIALGGSTLTAGRIVG